MSGLQEVPQEPAACQKTSPCYSFLSNCEAPPFFFLFFFLYSSRSQCLLVFSHFSAQDLSAVLFSSSQLGWSGCFMEFKGARGVPGFVSAGRSPARCRACLWFSFPFGGDVPGSGGTPGVRFLPRGAPRLEKRVVNVGLRVGQASPGGFSLCRRQQLRNRVVFQLLPLLEKLLAAGVGST